MIQELFKACFFILMAEMGDKTQILAMAFATKYPVKKVLLGVLIGSFLNHGLAVLLGAYLSVVVPLSAIRLIAACSFIAFGLWSLKPEEDEVDEEAKEKFGPVLTVAMAFFIGELGDKTQLTAITLSTNAVYPAFILMGTVLGMVITSGIGIIVGSRLGRRIPEFAMKLASSAIFMFFGVLGLLESVPAAYINYYSVPIFLAALSLAVWALLTPSVRKIKEKKLTAMKSVAARLQQKSSRIKSSIDSLCLGEDFCGQCQKGGCVIGYAREALEETLDKGEYILSSKRLAPGGSDSKAFDDAKLQQGLMTIAQSCLSCGKEHQKNCVLNRIRENLELQLFGEKLPFQGDAVKYLALLQEKGCIPFTAGQEEKAR